MQEKVCVCVGRRGVLDAGVPAMPPKRALALHRAGAPVEIVAARSWVICKVRVELVEWESRYLLYTAVREMFGPEGLKGMVWHPNGDFFRVRRFHGGGLRTRRKEKKKRKGEKVEIMRRFIKWEDEFSEQQRQDKKLNKKYKQKEIIIIFDNNILLMEIF